MPSPREPRPADRHPGRSAIPAWAGPAAATLRWPLWVAYVLSGMAYVVRIREALWAARQPGFVPVLLGASGWASEIFFLVGTVHWVAVGIHRIASPPRAAASMVLAGLHILLFAVRVWLAPMLAILDAAGR